MIRIILIVLGIIFLFAVPPLQKPDEETHFLRSLALARRVISCNSKEAMRPIPTAYSDMIADIKLAIPQYSRHYTFPVKLYDKPIFLKTDTTTPMQFARYCRFPVISYIPQAMGIGIGLLFSFNPYITFFLGRMVLFIVSVIWIEKLLRRSPAFLAPFYTLVFCMPLFIHQMTSYGYDVIPVLLFFTFFSHIWSMTIKQKLSPRNWLIALGLLALFLVSRRGGYEPLGLLLFLPLSAAHGKQLTRYWWVGMLALAGAVIYGLFMAANYESYGAQGMPIDANPAQQLAFIHTNPISALRVIGATIISKTWFYVLSSIGVLGMLEYRVSAFVYALYALFFVYVIATTNKQVKINGTVLYSTVGVIIIEMLYLMFVLYTTWTRVGNEVVEGIQGRYFWPLVPLVGLLLVQARPRAALQIPLAKKLLFTLLVAAFISICYTLLQRYYR